MRTDLICERLAEWEAKGETDTAKVAYMMADHEQMVELALELSEIGYTCCFTASVYLTIGYLIITKPGL